MMKRPCLLFFFFLLFSLSGAEIYCGASPEVAESECFATPENEIPFAAPNLRMTFSGSGVKIALKVPHLTAMYRETGKNDDDPGIFAGECVEILLSPRPESGEYYHIGVNPAGYVYSAKKRDVSWGKTLRAAVKKGDFFWEAEVFVPYAELGVARPEAGEKWRLNFGVSPVGEKGGHLAVNWQGSTSFHDISEYGTLVFGNETFPVMKKWVCADGKVVATLKGTKETARAFCRVGGKEIEGGKKGDDFYFDFALPERVGTLKNRLECRFYAEDKNGTQSLVRKGFAPFETRDFFTLGAFYCRNTDKTLDYTHRATCPAHLAVKKDGKTLYEKSDVPEKGTIPLAGFTPGRYTAELTAGKSRSALLFFVVPETFSPPQIMDNERLAIDGQLLRIGKDPIFLFGASEMPKFPLAFDSAFNLGGEGQKCVQSNGVRFTPQPGVKRSIVYPDGKRIASDLVAEIAGKYAESPRHDRTFARLAYEAQIPLRVRNASGEVEKIDSSRVFRELYEGLKSRFPDRFFSIHFDHPDLAARYAKSCDIVEMTVWRSSFSADPARFLAEDMKRAKAVSGGKPVIFWFGASLPSPLLRQAEILRFAVYTAMAEKMSGIVFHLGHGGVPREMSRIWSLLAGINAETQRFYPVFAEGRERDDFVLSNGGDCFRLETREYRNAIYLAAYNLSEEEKTLNLQTAIGNVNEDFTPLEVKIFRFPVKPGVPPQDAVHATIAPRSVKE